MREKPCERCTGGLAGSARAPRLRAGLALEEREAAPGKPSGVPGRGVQAGSALVCGGAARQRASVCIPSWGLRGLPWGRRDEKSWAPRVRSSGRPGTAPASVPASVPDRRGARSCPGRALQTAGRTAFVCGRELRPEPARPSGRCVACLAWLGVRTTIWLESELVLSGPDPSLSGGLRRHLDCPVQS